MRDRRAVARYAGLTGSPDESGSKRREKGLAKSGNARVRRGLIQLAWRFLRFQKDSALAQWYRARTGGPKGVRKTTIMSPSPVNCSSHYAAWSPPARSRRVSYCGRQCNRPGKTERTYRFRCPAGLSPERLPMTIRDGVTRAEHGPEDRR